MKTPEQDVPVSDEGFSGQVRFGIFLGLKGFETFRNLFNRYLDFRKKAFKDKKN